MEPDPANNPDDNRQNSLRDITQDGQPPQTPPFATNTFSDQFPQKSKPRGVMVLLVSMIVLMVAIAAAVTYLGHNSKATTKSSGNNNKLTATGPIDTLVAANNDFGVNAFNQLIQQSPEANTFISPASISMALSMVYNGAGGATKTAMQQTLNYQKFDLASINKQNLSLITGLKNPDKGVTLSIANSAWLRKGTSINQSFLDTVKQSYQAQASVLNFNSPEAPNTINNWVSTNTNGKIPSLVDQIPDSAVMYLVNAVYFNGNWTKAFDKTNTQDYPFNTGKGKVVQTPLMSQDGTYNYFESNGLQAIQLPYGENKSLSMNVYLPKDINSFLKSFNYAQLTDLSKKYTESQGTILLPKFKLNYAKDLSTTLANMGMGVAFQDGANFDNIGPDLKISDVKHATYISVDETGTEAAATTSVGVAATSAVNESPSFLMRVDKPFVFTIQDNTSNDILFIGLIQDPSQ